MPSELKVNKLSPYTGTTLTLGDSGDTVSTNAVVQASQFVGGGLNAYRNIIINGDMSLAQRGTSVSGITNFGYRTVDRWQFYIDTMGTWTMSQSTDVPTGQGFAYSTKLDCTTADASPSANDALILQQLIEGQNLQYLKKGTSNAESLTLSFWVKCTKTGSFALSLRDNDNNRRNNQLVTINSANTWEKKILSYDGDTTGAFANDNGLSLTVQFWLDSGSTYNSGTQQSGWVSQNSADINAGNTLTLADSTANDFYITGVQLEAGTSASDFEFLPYDVNLQRCQRYLIKYEAGASNNYATMSSGVCYSTTRYLGYLQLPTTMRTEPSTSPTSPTNILIVHAGTSDAITNLVLTGSNLTMRVDADVASGLTSGNGGYVQLQPVTGDTVFLDAEL